MKKHKILIQRIMYSLFLLCIIQIGRNILLPGLKVFSIPETSETQLMTLVMRTTGGDFSTPSLFALGMGPYMTALIIWSTISISEIDWIKNLSLQLKGYFQRALTFIFSVIQAFIFLPKIKVAQNLDNVPTMGFFTKNMIIIIYLVGGSMILSWLADRNCENGIGGQSLFIIPSMMANVPAMLISGRTGKIVFTSNFLIFLGIITLLFLMVTIFLYNSEYRVSVERIGITSNFAHSYIPIRLLTFGAMPFMFAVTFFSLPSLLLMSSVIQDTTFSYWLTRLFNYNTVEGIMTYGVVNYLLALAFSFINVRPYDIAKNLRESGDYILNEPPGRKTEKFFRKKLLMISLVGSIYMLCVSLIPLFVGLKNKEYSNLSFYFGSLFMIIVTLENIKNEVKFIYQMESYTLLKKR